MRNILSRNPKKGAARKGAGKGKGAGRRARAARGSTEYAALLVLTMILLAFGIVMVFSASWASSYMGETQDSLFYLKRELIFAGLGLALMFFMARFDYGRLRKLAPLLMAVSLGLLLVVLIPGIGVSAKGARRWLSIGFMGFQPQPAELAKLAVIMFAASVVSARPRLLGSLRAMFVPLLLMPVAACGLVLVEPDMGTAITICLTLGAILVVAGIQLRVLALPALGGGLLATLSVLVSPHQAARITSFIDPWKDAQGAGYQVIQSWVALASGGLFGVGIGNSVQKYDWLPEHHTDMILSIVGEELGLVGLLAVLTAFLAFAFIGFRIALKCRDPFGKYLAAGITTLVVSQAAVNFCAVTGLLPLTGVPLPVISYGGSSLVIILASIGILLNISINKRSQVAVPSKRKLRAIDGGNRRRRNGRAPGARAGAGRRAHA